MNCHKLLICSISVLPMSCAGIKTIPKNELTCSANKDFEVKVSTKIKNHFIFTDGEKFYQAFNLESNKFECIPDENLNQKIDYGFAQPKAIYSAATRIEKGENDIEFFSAPLNGKSLVDRTEEICKKADLKYIFGTQLAEARVLGCQATKKSQSAIMFRVDDDDDESMTIATMTIYAPLLQSTIN
jgi:hypothetical protein